jgi:hypothetical protein
MRINVLDEPAHELLRTLVFNVLPEFGRAHVAQLAWSHALRQDGRSHRRHHQDKSTMRDLP